MLRARQRSEAGIVVLGAGPAGLSAAMAVRSAGVPATVVDVTGQLGGNGAFSTGYMAFADFAVQHQLGIRDDPDNFLRDLVAEVARIRSQHDVEFDHDLARRYAVETRGSYEFLIGLGFRFGRLIPRPRQHTTDRMVALVDPGQFRDIFTERLGAIGAQILIRAKASCLMFSKGQVIGTVIEIGGEVADLRASAVIVATGGYQANQDLRRQFGDPSPSSPYPGLETARGDGHRMIEDVGGELVNMDLIPRLVRTSSRLVEDCIAINGDGQRFHDEAGPYEERLSALTRQAEGIGYYITDSFFGERDAQLIADMPLPPKKFQTLEAASRAVGCEPATLIATVAGWNETVENGSRQDTAFGRVVFPSPRVGLHKPPFVVIPMVMGIACTGGGARVTLDMQVVDRSGRPIPGLYAAGDCAGTINAAYGLGGIHLSSAVTMGLVAGRSAVAASSAALR